MGVEAALKPSKEDVEDAQVEMRWSWKVRAKKRQPIIMIFLNLPNPIFLLDPYRFHIRVYNKNLQKSRV